MTCVVLGPTDTFLIFIQVYRDLIGYIEAGPKSCRKSPTKWVGSGHETENFENINPAEPNNPNVVTGPKDVQIS